MIMMFRNNVLGVTFPLYVSVKSATVKIIALKFNRNGNLSSVLQFQLYFGLVSLSENLSMSNEDL